MGDEIGGCGEGGSAATAAIFHSRLGGCVVGSGRAFFGGWILRVGYGLIAEMEMRDFGSGAGF